MKQKSLFLLISLTLCASNALSQGRSPSDLIGMVESAEAREPVVSGSCHVTCTMPEVVAGDEKIELASQVLRFNGDYQFVCEAGDWALTRTFDLRRWSGINNQRMLLYKPFNDSVLSQEYIISESDDRGFLAGHIDRRSVFRFGTSNAGYSWIDGRLVSLLRDSQNLQTSPSKSGFAISGVYKGWQLSAQFSPKLNYRATSLSLKKGSLEQGFQIVETQEFEGKTYPKRVEIWLPAPTPDSLRGERRYKILLSLQSGEQPSWARKLPKTPPSAVVGSDVNKLYVADLNGKFVESGKQGRQRPRFGVSFSGLFILSGAGLLLYACWRLMLRK